MKKKVFSKWCLALPSLRPPHCLSFFVSGALLCKNISSSSSSPIKKREARERAAGTLEKIERKKGRTRFFHCPN
jgi:hypothetical protein